MPSSPLVGTSGRSLTCLIVSRSRWTRHLALSNTACGYGLLICCASATMLIGLGRPSIAEFLYEGGALC